MSKLTYELAKSLWHYDPVTGDLFRAINLSDPIRKLWYPEKDGKGYRCQVNHEGTNHNYKAAQVAWVLLTKADLGSKVDVMHLNGDATNNAAANLYLQIPPGPGDTRGPMSVLADTPLARAILPEGIAHPDGTWRAHIVVHGDGKYARAFEYLDEKEEARYRAAGYQGERRHASTLTVTDMTDFARWCVAKFPANLEAAQARIKAMILANYGVLP
jgi:hypothetical protein